MMNFLPHYNKRSVEDIEAFLEVEVSVLYLDTSSQVDIKRQIFEKILKNFELRTG